MKDETVYLRQILESVSKISDFVSGLNKEQFFADAKTQSAVILQLMLIGEIAKKVSAKTKENIELPWKDIAGFRDQAIHNYFDVDLAVVWNTTTTDLPILKERLEKFLK